MAKTQKYWFSSLRGLRGSFPISWEGWVVSLASFFLAVLVLRETQGAIRVGAILLLIVIYWAVTRGRTKEYGN
jgi:hypothetical protein